MGKSAWDKLLSALQHELAHGLNLQGQRVTGIPQMLRKVGAIKNATKVVQGSVGTQTHKNETACLGRMIPVANREYIVAGSVCLAHNAATRYHDRGERKRYHDMVSGRLLFLSQDDEMGRGTEVAQSQHLGGLTRMPSYHHLGPNAPQNLVFTHNMNKQFRHALDSRDLNPTHERKFCARKNRLV